MARSSLRDNENVINYGRIEAVLIENAIEKKKEREKRIKRGGSTGIRDQKKKKEGGLFGSGWTMGWWTIEINCPICESAIRR